MGDMHSLPVRDRGVMAARGEPGYSGVDPRVVKDKDGRRNRYHIQHDLPLREAVGRERTIGEVLELLTQDGRGAA